MTAEQSRAAHGAHEDERHRARLEAKCRTLLTEAETRYRSNLTTCLPVVDPQPCDYPGCVE